MYKISYYEVYEIPTTYPGCGFQVGIFKSQQKAISTAEKFKKKEFSQNRILVNRVTLFIENDNWEEVKREFKRQQNKFCYGADKYLKRLSINGESPEIRVICEVRG